MVRARLPLLWFDRALRVYGPLLPLPILALRLASHWADLPSSERPQVHVLFFRPRICPCT